MFSTVLVPVLNQTLQRQTQQQPGWVDCPRCHPDIQCGRCTNGFVYLDRRGERVA